VVPFDEGHWREALAAFIRFGKGRHPAGLNFGDCLSYATATIAAQPLLAVGEDFAKTDLVVA
jgi:ribonuclease VapC